MSCCVVASRNERVGRQGMMLMKVEEAATDTLSYSDTAHSARCHGHSSAGEPLDWLYCSWRA